MALANADFHPKPGETWALIANSNLIVSGTLDAPVETIRGLLTSDQNREVKLSVKCEQVIKGSAPVEFQIKWFAGPRADSVDPERVIQLNGRKVLLFLHSYEKTLLSGGGIYFTGSNPQSLADPSEALLEQIRDEVSLERKVLASFAHSVPTPDLKVFQKVRKLIDATVHKESQMDSFKRLEELGWEAVPSIIILMDDRRDLAIPHIELENPEGVFEGIRQYGPEKVVDAMTAILNQITGEDFGLITDGGSERERKASVDGWGMFLYYWEKSREVSTAKVMGQKRSDTIAATTDFRTSVLVAGELMVYEGLPKQSTERDLLARELKRKDIMRISGYPFYTPAVVAVDREGLKKLFGDPKTAIPSSGIKLCGLFHPDYAIEWKYEGRVYRVLICYGCHEALYLEGERELLYDLDEAAYLSLRGALSGHVSKRPKADQVDWFR